MRMTGAHQSQPGSSSSGKQSTTAWDEGCKTWDPDMSPAACLSGPTSRVLTKGSPNHLASLSQLEHRGT